MYGFLLNAAVSKKKRTRYCWVVGYCWEEENRSVSRRLLSQLLWNYWEMLPLLLWVCCRCMFAVLSHGRDHGVSELEGTWGVTEANSWFHTGPHKKTYVWEICPGVSWTLTAQCHDHCSGEPVPVPNNPLLKNLFTISVMNFPCCSFMPLPQVLLLITLVVC